MNSSKLKVLSLCDGLSGGMLAFKSLGMEVEYHSVEIDKHARKLSDHNFPLEIIRWEDDVTKITKEMIEENGPFDWIMFGSPCQSVSVSGKGEGLNGSSGLLLNCLQVKKWCEEFNPDIKFLIENVKMKKEFLEQFDSLIGNQRILINSALVSAQNRQRYYWTNFVVSQPEDMGELLKDILEEIVPENLYITPKNIHRITESRILWDPKLKGKDSQQDRAHTVEGKSPSIPATRTENKCNIFEFVDRDKSYCIDASYHKGATLREYIEKSRRQVVFAYSSSGRGTHIDARSNISGKSNTCTTGSGCMGGLKSANLVGKLVPGESGIAQRARGFNKGGIHKEKSPTVGSSSWERNNTVANNIEGTIVFRMLSIRECARLQKIPEWYDFSPVSKTQAYKAIGNGWTISTISHILEYGLGLKQPEGWEFL